MIVGLLVSTVVCMGGHCTAKPEVHVDRGPVVCTPRGCRKSRPKAKIAWVAPVNSAPLTDGLVWSALAEANRELGAPECTDVVVYDEPDRQVMARGLIGECGVFVPRRQVRLWREWAATPQRAAAHTHACMVMLHERRHNLGLEHGDPGMGLRLGWQCVEYGQRVTG